MSFVVGDKVVFNNKSFHDSHPEHYPAVGTIGEVTCSTFPGKPLVVKVQWPKGSTSMNDKWFCEIKFLETPTQPGP